jgi:hypothetical protein
VDWVFAMLKDADRLLEPDPAYAEAGPFGGITIEELRLDASKFELPTSVPDGVRRCHDAARHAYIYSYFSYDLLTPGVSQLFSCLELALRKRLGHPSAGKSPPPKIFNMLRKAKELKFISSDISVVHKFRHIFQHGTENIVDPNTFLNMLDKVTSLIRELYDPSRDGSRG